MEFFNKSNMECLGCQRLFSEMGLRAHSKFCKGKIEISSPLHTNHNPNNTVSLGGNSSRHDILEFLRQSRHDDPHEDVTVVTAEREIISCHCLVLAAASPVWADLLDLPSREDETVLIVSEDMSTALWRNLLDLLYTGKVLVEGERLEELQKILEIYCIKCCVEVERDVIVKDEVDGFEDINTEPLENFDDEFDTTINTKHEKLYNEFVINGLEERNGEGEENETNFEKLNGGNVPAETIQCDYCIIVKPSLVKVKWHVKKSHSEKLQEFSDKYEHYGCDLCTKRFINKKMRMSHKKKKHPNYKRGKRPRVLYPEDGLPWVANRKCPHCSKIVNTIAKYDDHLKTHSSGHYPYSCKDCEFKCQRGVSFRNHIKKHEPLEHPLLCIVCGQSFMTEFEHRKHGKKIHAKYTKRVVVEPSAVLEDLLCNLCGKSFDKKTKLGEHLKFAHVKEEDKFQCTECDFKTAVPTNFKRHKLLHKPPTLKCDHCDKMFHTEIYRRNHTKTKHTEDHLKEFRCAQCGKGFVNVDVYNGHMNMHQGLKPYKCRYCDNCYQNHSNCMAHEKKIHPELYVKRRKEDHLGGIRVAKR